MMISLLHVLSPWLVASLSFSCEQKNQKIKIFRQMNKRINKLSIIASVVMLLLFSSATDCQIVFPAHEKSVKDSLTLKEIIKVVITTHPTVKTAEEAISNANNRIAMAR